MNHPLIADIEPPALTRAALTLNAVADTLYELFGQPITSATSARECYALILEKADALWQEVKHGTRTQARIHAEWVAVRAAQYLIDVFGESPAAALNLVAEELQRAMRKFGPMVSAHEGYAVILEELDELWWEIRHGIPSRSHDEAVQVAAMAIRFLVDIPGDGS